MIFLLPVVFIDAIVAIDAIGAIDAIVAIGAIDSKLLANIMDLARRCKQKGDFFCCVRGWIYKCTFSKQVSGVSVVGSKVVKVRGLATDTPAKGVSVALWGIVRGAVGSG